MKESTDWYNSLIEALKPFSDKEYQERTWSRGEGEKISTFIEATCQLFDDTALSDFLDYNDKIIVSKKCDDILRKISSLIDAIDEKLNQIDIINHKSMTLIRPLAVEAIRLIEAKIKQ